MRKQIVVGNWKMNTLLQEGMKLAEDINENFHTKKYNREIAIAPPFTHLSEINKIIHPEIGLFAQNCAAESAGAYTGEVSAVMLKSMGIRGVILGHSERRQYYGDTDEVLTKKVNQAYENNLKVIFCCGESLEQRKAGKHKEVVTSQIKNATFHLPENLFQNIIIAYEPVWAIGTGETATAEQAQEIHATIRKFIAEKYSQATADKIRILYGGSVKPNNANKLFAQDDIDGGLIGGAALKHESFDAIIEA